MKLDHVEDVPSQKSAVVFLPVGDSEVELVKPTSDDSGVAKFLAERGGGMHHLCFEVDDIDGMLIGLKAKGVRLINETPQELPGRKMAFVHPKSTGGVLVELYEVTKVDLTLNRNTLGDLRKASKGVSCLEQNYAWIISASSASAARMPFSTFTLESKNMPARKKMIRETMLNRLSPITMDTTPKRAGPATLENFSKTLKKA